MSLIFFNQVFLFCFAFESVRCSQGWRSCLLPFIFNTAFRAYCYFSIHKNHIAQFFISAAPPGANTRVGHLENWFRMKPLIPLCLAASLFCWGEDVCGGRKKKLHQVKRKLDGENEWLRDCGMRPWREEKLCICVLSTELEHERGIFTARWLFVPATSRYVVRDISQHQVREPLLFVPFSEEIFPNPWNERLRGGDDSGLTSRSVHKTTHNTHSVTHISNRPSQDKHLRRKCPVQKWRLDWILK